MTHRLALCLLLLCAVHTASAQDKPQMDEKDIAKLAERITELRSAEKEDGRNRDKNVERATEKFRSEIARLTEVHGEAKLPLMEESWRAVFHRALNDAKGRPGGVEGNVGERKAGFTYRDELLEVEYSVYLPKGYRNQESWPVIFCFHDDGEKSDGRKYIQEVWMSDPARDQFVIVAPTFEKKTVGRNAKAQERIDRTNINDFIHIRVIMSVLADVMENYKVDAERIYLDGVGRGARVAFDLALARTKNFAGLAVRSGTPTYLKFLGNLAGMVPVLVLDRENGVYATGDGPQIKSQMEQLAKDTGVNLEFKSYPVLTDKGAERKALGSSKVDQIPEGSADVAAFFADKRRDLNPRILRLGTWNSRYFKRSGWVVLERAEGDPEAGTESSFVGEIKDDNTIDVKVVNVERFSIFTSSRWLDLAKPIKIVVNGKTVREEVVPPSLDYMLKYFNSNAPDSGHIVLGAILVDVPVEPQGGATGGEGGSGDKR